MTENNFEIISAAVSDRGLSEKRPQNEDSFLEMKNLGLFAVADGVGGAQAGDVASQMSMEILSEAFANLKANGDAEEMMRIAIEHANSAIFQMSNDLPQLSTMATTIVALHLSGNIATIGHVGDSRLYRLDAKGSLYRETQDHSVVEEEVRAGRMTAAQAANHPSRNVISRALGAESTVEVDMKTIMFDGNTAFLLCSDGITRHINDFEIRELLLSAASPEEICAKMKEICYSRGAEDNLTAVIVNALRSSEDNIQDFPTVVPPFEEEATVAAARPAAYTDPGPVDLNPDDDEIPTRALEMPAAMQQAAPESAPAANPVYPSEPVSLDENPPYSNDDDESYLMAEPSPATPATPPANIPEPASVYRTEPAARIEPETPVFVQPKPVEAPKNFTVLENEEKNGGGKFLSSLIWLVVGAILGIAGYYFWLTMTARPAEIPALVPQTSNPATNTADALRYEAEANPEKVVKQYETATPKDATDFYTLGRAFMNLKRYDEAKVQFILARNNLPAVTDAKTKAVLATDITQGITISQDKTAQAAFERERKLLTGEAPNGQSNLNSNAISNGPANFGQ